MKPEEKAEELMAIYGTTLVTFNEDSEEWEDCTEHAKQCALICVDEIMKTFIDIDPRLRFWQEVKSIIQEL